MKIAIIGAGNVGRALGTSFVRAGHDVTYAARTVEHARGAADAVGGSAVASPSEAARVADVVVLAVPNAAGRVSPAR